MKIQRNNLIFCFPKYNTNSEILAIANSSPLYTKLRNDIKKNGIINPLLVEDLKNGKYKVWVGNMRLAAAQILKIKELECVIITDTSPKALKAKKKELFII